VLDSINQKFTGKERDAESGNDYFGARYYASSMGRFMSPDPMIMMPQKMTDPQQWNMYSYVRNNPLRMIDTNGKWPTDIHNAIINGAFGGLSASQRGVLQAASKRVDGYLNGGQSAATAYKHGMRGPWESQSDARSKADKFISDNESKASGIAKQNGKVTDGALDAMGTALHTISDRTSPAHEGEQVWTGAGEPGASSLAGPLGTLAGAITDGVRAEIHVEEESTITLDQYHTTIDDERAAYLQTFGQDAFTQATGCKQVAGCGYNDSALPANLKKPQ
jgi:RHS repeat-associated protein